MFFPLSFSDIYMYLKCPHSFLLKKQRAPKIEIVLPSHVKRGEFIHEVIARYYQKLLEDDTVLNRRKEPFQVLMQITGANEHERYFKNFLRFEKRRIQRNWRIVEVEQEHKTQYFIGICDAVFSDEEEKRIVVDWKVSSYFNKNYEVQGAIYKHIANADTVIFLLLGSGRELVIETENAEKRLQEIVKKILRGEFERNEDEKVCSECEFSVYCLQQRYWKCFEEVWR